VEVVLARAIVIIEFLEMTRVVEREEEFGLFVLVDVDGSDEVGPLAVDVVETSDIAAALVDQIELVAVAYANLILRLTVGREAVARIDQGDDDGRFAQLEFPQILETFDGVGVAGGTPGRPCSRMSPLKQQDFLAGGRRHSKVRSSLSGYGVEVSTFGPFESLVFEMLAGESCRFGSARIHFKTG